MLAPLPAYKLHYKCLNINRVRSIQWLSSFFLVGDLPSLQPFFSRTVWLYFQAIYPFLWYQHQTPNYISKIAFDVKKVFFAFYSSARLTEGRYYDCSIENHNCQCSISACLKYCYGTISCLRMNRIGGNCHETKHLSLQKLKSKLQLRLSLTKLNWEDKRSRLPFSIMYKIYDKR